MTFHIGETLNVGYYGVKVVDITDLGDAEITVELDCVLGTYRLTVPLGVAEVQRVIPAEGELQPGDVWKDSTGNPWFAARYYPDYDNKEDSRGVNADGWRTVLVPEDISEAGAPKRPEDVNQDYGPMTLVYREASPGQVEPEPAASVRIDSLYGRIKSEDVTVSHPDWNDGKPVVLTELHGRFDGRVEVTYGVPETRDYLSATVPADTLVTPYGGAA
ncbi:hypothetical protein [Streptosporangium sp. CA-115845]|uniref:hypothetical protein n=1 Tax=Streptosporangium sp. CA-115845 TaxID=3240071 RepID=UPI003D8D1187